MQEAAAVPLVALAAQQILVDRAHIQPGQKVLVHAGAAGSDRPYPARRTPRRHVATTASRRDADLGRTLGADVVVDYTKQDSSKALSGYDLVMDSLGGESLDKSLAVFEPGGLAIGVTGPPDAGFAKQLGPPRFMGVPMGLLSRTSAIKRRNSACGTSSSS